MADRTISVRLRASITEYQAAMAKAAHSTKELKGEIGQATQKTSVFKQGTQQLGTGMLVAGGAVAAGFAMATRATMGFDKAMSEVSAVAGASAEQMGQLRQAAIDAGAATAFSATEAATAQAELVKAGISVEDVLGGALAGALDLAAAGSLELADAAEIAAQAMNIFNLQGEDVTHIADVLAAGANKSAADVGQLGDALRQGGLVAAQTGLSLEETAGALSAFADNALIGSDAGTSLKTMLQRLTPQSDEAAQLMEQLGFSAYDAQGNFIGLEALAGELRDALGSMSVEQRNAAMSTLFGSDAVRAANILYSQGSGGIRTYVEAVNDQGAAADMAAEKLDNLAGDLEELGGSVETALIQGGSKATGVLRGLAQGATDVVNGFGGLPDTVQTTALVLGGIAGAASLAGGGFLMLAPRIVETRAALAALAQTAPTATAALSSMTSVMGVLGAALPGLMIGMTTWGNIQSRGAQISKDFVDSLPEPQTLQDRADNINAMIREYERLQRIAASGGGAGKHLRELGQNLNPFAENEISDAERATHELAAAIEAATGEYEKMAPAIQRAMELTGLTDIEVMELAERLGVDLTAAGFDGTAAIGSVVAEAKRIGEGIPETERMTMSLEDQEEAAEALLETLEDLGDAAGEFTDAVGGYEVVFDRAEQAAKESAQAQVDAANETVDERIDAIRRGADATATQLQREADDHIRTAKLTGQAAEDVRRAAQDKAEAVRDSADEEAQALEDNKSSWEDYVGEVTVSTEELIAEWEKQVEALNNWRSNLQRIAIRGRSDVADELAKMGPEGATLVEQFANMTDAEFDRAGDLFVQSMTDGGSEAGKALRTQLDIAAAIGKDGAHKTAQMIADELGVGLEQVKAVADQYGIVLGESFRKMWEQIAVNRFLLGLAQIEAQQGGARTAGPQVYADGKALGGLVAQRRALGGPIYRAFGGPSGTDTVPAWLTPGEFVMRKSAVDALGVGFLSALNRGQFTKAGFGMMASASTSTDNRSVTVNNYYPEPERASDAIGRSLRKARHGLGVA